MLHIITCEYFTFTDWLYNACLENIDFLLSFIFVNKRYYKYKANRYFHYFNHN